jgi:hypothetical protein
MFDMIEKYQQSGSPPKVFLINKNGQLMGFGVGATDNNLEDFGVANVDGDPYWDRYGTGVYLISTPGPGAPGQLMYVNLASKQRTPLTNGTCILPADVMALFGEAPYCGFMSPIAASTYGGLAFIQQVIGSEQPNWHVMISSGGQITLMDSYLDTRPNSLTWSADGEWLLYQARVDNLEDKDLRAVNRAGKQCDYPGVDPRPIEYVEWSGRNGGEIVYSSGGDLWLVPLKPHKKNDRCPVMQLSKKIQLTSGNDQDTRPQWLYVGDLIAFLSNRPTSGSASSGLWMINPDTLNIAPITNFSFPLLHTDWQANNASAMQLKAKGALR